MSYSYLLIDGHNFAWRAASTMYLSNSEGRPVNVEFGMIRMIRTLLEKFLPKTLGVCWDAGRSRSKLAVFPEYKADRKTDLPTDTIIDIRAQIANLQKILPYFNIRQVIREGVECDDLIGLLCSSLEKVLVVSSDKGLFQVVRMGADMYLPSKDVILNKDNFKEIAGIELDIYPFQLALCGHKGGGICGLRGFGDKTAEILFSNFGPWAEWWSQDGRLRIGVLEKLKKNQRSTLLSSEARGILERNLKLVKLGFLDQGLQEEIVKDFLDQKLQFNTEKIQEFFEKNEFESYMRSFGVFVHPFRKLI